MDHGIRSEATRAPEQGALVIDLAAFRRPKTSPKPQHKAAWAECGSGGYHDAAIRAEQAPREV